MVQNIAFGGTDKLPFDLRGRRILPYYLNESIENKVVEKEKLKNELFTFFKHALQHYSKAYNPKEKPIWWGIWTMNRKAKVRGGNLHIIRVSSDAFLFEIQIYDGARLGHVSGRAQILTPHSAYSRIKTFNDKACELIFHRRLENEKWIIDITESFECHSFHGMGASFSGDYEHQTEYPFILGYLDEIDLNEIERITGKYITGFLENFQQPRLEEYDPSEPGFKVVAGGVKGLYTIMESIVVLDDTGKVWCACLDPEINEIRYFDNLNSKSTFKPKAMQKWLSRFSDKEIIENDRGE